MSTEPFDPRLYRPWKELDPETQKFVEFVYRRWREDPTKDVRPEVVRFETGLSQRTAERALRQLLVLDRGIRPTLLALLYVDAAQEDLHALDRLVRLAHERYRPDAEKVPWEEVKSHADLQTLTRLRRLALGRYPFQLVEDGDGIALVPGQQAVDVDSLGTLLSATSEASRAPGRERTSHPVPFRLRLTRLTARHYRAFHALDLPLGPLTVLVGPNGSGKSTLLDLVAFLSRTARDGIVTAMSADGGFERIRTHGTNEGLSLGAGMTLDYGDGRPLEAALELDVQPFAGRWAVERERLQAGSQELVDGVRGRARVDGRDVFHAPDVTAFEGIDDEKNHPLQTQLRRALEEVVLIERDPLLDAPSSVWRYDETKRKRLTLDAPDLIDRVAESEQSTQALSTSLRALLPRIDRVERHVLPSDHPERPSRPVLTVVERTGHELHLEELSAGTRQMLLLCALYVLEPAPTAILLEEPDGGIHPGAQPALRDLLRSLATRSTVIVTTHSPSFVSLLDPVKEVVALEVDEDGAHARPLSEALASRTWLQSFDPQEAFLRYASERVR